MPKTAVFDFAGVLTTERCFPAIARICEERFRVPAEQLKEEMYKHDIPYMEGAISSEQFWELTAAKFGIPFEEFMEVFTGWYTYNKEVIALLRELRGKHTTILLTDNFEPLTEQLRTELKQHFDRLYFSCELGVIKKNTEPFITILRELQLQPAECVFIDDKEANLIAPRSLGMHTILFGNAEQLEEELKKLL